MEDLQERPEDRLEACDKCPHVASVAIYSRTAGLPALFCGCCLAPVWRSMDKRGKGLIVVPLSIDGVVSVYRRLVIDIEEVLPDDKVDRIRREVQRGGTP